MLNYFKLRKEKRILSDAFKEASTISAWLCIECIDRNEEFFLDHFELLAEGKQYVEKGMAYQETGNSRAAYNFFMSFINEILSSNPEIINGHEELKDAKKRVLDLSNNIISPLFAKLDAAGEI